MRACPAVAIGARLPGRARFAPAPGGQARPDLSTDKSGGMVGRSPRYRAGVGAAEIHFRGARAVLSSALASGEREADVAGSVDESERDGGWSALMTAAEAGDAAGVAAAIAAGAEVNAADEDGWTALHLAALNDRAAWSSCCWRSRGWR